MSKSTLGVIVSFLFTIASIVAPVPDDYRMLIFVSTIVLILLACAWWFVAHRRESRASASSRNSPPGPKENANRPKLVLLNQGASINPDGGTCFFFTVKNIGPVAVQKADFSFVIQTARLAKPPVVQHEPTSQPIIEGTPRTIRYSFPPKGDPEPAYIAFYVSYIGDGQQTKWDNAPVFLVWRGVKDGIANPELEYLRDEEINRFKEYLRKHELPKSLL